MTRFLCLLDTPQNDVLQIGVDRTSFVKNDREQYLKLMIGIHKSKPRDPCLHTEIGFKMSPYVHFAAKSELQNVPGHPVLFRKQTHGECGFHYKFDYNKWIH